MVNIREELKKISPGGKVDIFDVDIQRDLLLTVLLSKFELRGQALARGVMPQEVVEAASGKLVKESISKGFITNSRTARLQISYLSRLSRTAARPAFVLGFLGTAAFSRSWAVNELSDATTGLSIAMNQAERSGDIEGFKRAKEMLDDIANPDIIDKVIAEIPTLNVAVNSLKKIRAARLTADIAEQRILKSQEVEALEKQAVLDKAELIRAETVIRQDEERQKLEGTFEFSGEDIPFEEAIAGKIEAESKDPEALKANVERQKAREQGERAELKTKKEGERAFKARRPSTKDPALRVKPRKKESPVSKLK